MVVVPTSEHVTMRYERTPPDLAGLVLTLLGLVGLVLLARARPIDVPPLPQGRLSRGLDEVLTLPPASRPGSPHSEVPNTDVPNTDVPSSDVPHSDVPSSDGPPP